MSAEILVVDDDRKTVDLIRLYLEREGYRVRAAFDGRQALDSAKQAAPDLVVLDLMLPRVDGLDVCQAIRASSATPIIMLTARSTEEEKLLGLELGADDYLTKPFSPRELVARVRAVLRRSVVKLEPVEPVARHGDLVIDFGRHEVSVQDQPVALTPREFRLLRVLAANPGRVFSRFELIERAFGLDYDGLERTVDVHLSSLRRKIEPDPTDPTYVLTVYGVGYRFARLPARAGGAGGGAG
ncbi:MAG TPA: response regulator transcription factor [Chloroflexota bacterium]|jgi:DNA-binding response OmpR family regulator|nr:response regulator transcription factor [Chloroflexota bacterium]